MIGIIKGICQHRCAICHNDIQKGMYKVKDAQNNRDRKYYHLHCTPRHMLLEQLSLWNQARYEQETNQ